MKSLTVLFLGLLAAAAFGWQHVPVDTAGPAARAWWTRIVVRDDTAHIAWAVHTSQSPLQTAIRYARGPEHPPDEMSRLQDTTRDCRPLCCTSTLNVPGTVNK